MRLDSYAASTWVDGAVGTGLIADGTTLNSFTVLSTGWYLMAFNSCCDVAYAYNVQHVDTDGATVLRTYLVQLAAGTDRDIWPAPVNFRQNQILRARLNGAVTTTRGLQVTIWPHFVAPGQ